MISSPSGGVANVRNPFKNSVSHKSIPNVGNLKIPKASGISLPHIPNPIFWAGKELGGGVASGLKSKLPGLSKLTLPSTTSIKPPTVKIPSVASSTPLSVPKTTINLNLTNVTGTSGGSSFLTWLQNLFKSLGL